MHLCTPLPFCCRRQHRRELERATPGKDIRKRCPTCDFSWLDRYRKPDCPKCNRPLEVVPRLKPGEVSTFKYKAGDALESLGGACRKGGYHYFKVPPPPSDPSPPTAELATVAARASPRRPLSTGETCLPTVARTS